MANQIQIKRSTTTATPGSLANGELAFSSNGDVLFIGANGAVEPIGGKRTPGVLTANQALVANSTSGIDKVIVANLQPTFVYANGASGTVGQVLTSNSSGGLFWSAPAATTAGSNTQIQFNDSGILAGDADFTFNKTNNTLTVTNIAANGASLTSVNAASVGGNTASDLRSYSDTIAGTAYTNATSYAATIAGTAYSNATSYADNKAANAYSNAMSDTLSRNGTYTGNNIFSGANNTFSGANTTVTGFLKTANADIASILVRTSSLTSGSFDRNSLDLAAGDGLLLSGGNYGVNIRAANNGSSWFTLNLSGDNGALTPSANGTMDLGSSAKNFGGLWVQDVTVNGNTTLGSNSSDIIAITGRINSAIVPAANVTYDLGTSLMRWKDLYLSGSSIVLGNTTVTDGADGLTANNIKATIGLKTQDLTVDGNTVLGSNSSDIVSINGYVNTAITPSANVTYNLGTNLLRWNEIHAANVHSVDGYFDGNLQVTGNLVVLGDTLTVNVATLAVEDSLIQLATNNTSTDLLDIGFYGNYQAGGGAHEHTGLFRDASDDGIFKLFFGLQDAPTTSVDIAGTGYAQGVLQAYLKSGGLISNATHVAITANSTVNVAITANTLTLATALAATDGGTGFDTYTSGDLLVANTGNAFSKLALGTSGYVLQSNGSALVYGVLDGGSF
jgi:hypothetical protein